MTTWRFGRATLLASAMLTGCGGGPDDGSQPARPGPAVPVMVVRDTTIAAMIEAGGVAEPVARAVLSTKLMGTVTEVRAQEGDRVTRGRLLARIDARDIEAKRAQVEAGMAAADATQREARAQAVRFRALFADSAATRSQLDQAEAALARAEGGLGTARASLVELDAMRSYGEIRAPFDGIVTRRYVDPGAFAAPGSPVLEVQDASRLRISVTVPPRVVAAIAKQGPLEVRIEGRPASAVLEGAVPASGGAVYTVNAILANENGEFLPGTAAIIRIPDGERRGILVPSSALVHEGDLTGVRVRTADQIDLRWIRTGRAGEDGATEVLSGLVAGDSILIGER